MPPKKERASWRSWAIAALAALVLIVCLQNSHQVSVEVLVANFNAPLIVVLLVAVAAGAVIGYAAPILWRHHRKDL